MSVFSYEAELVMPVRTYFEQDGFTVFHEVRIGFCRADLVACTDETVIAVELKLADWKKAMVQAKNYQLAAEYVYLAFPLKKTNLVLKRASDQLDQEGIGLLSVNEQDQSIQVQQEAKKSKKMFARLNKQQILKRRERKEMKHVLHYF